MKRFFFSARVFIIALLSAVVWMLGVINVTFADTTYVVEAGDSLSSIARAYNIGINELATANALRWNSWVYVGQVLSIPKQEVQPEAAPAEAKTETGNASHVVQLGDTLYGIAVRNDTTVQALMSANQLSSTIIRVGQELTVPLGGEATGGAAYGVSNPAVNGEKWIDVNLSTQRISAYEGNTLIHSTFVSTGLPRTPTVVGSYRVYVKYEATDMRGGSQAAGDYYYLRNVPYTMYFYQGYGIHGTYWHNNFGQPMSHGCVNLPTSEAQWFFNWAPVGTRVETHY